MWQSQQGIVCQGPVSGCFILVPSVKLAPGSGQGTAGKSIVQSGRQKSSSQGSYYPPYTFKGRGLCQGWDVAQAAVSQWSTGQRISVKQNL